MARISSICLAVLLGLLPSAGVAHAATLTRDRDPVIVTGVRVPWLLGSPVDRIVAFRWQGGWTQIPVQVDERVVVDFGTVYNDVPLGITTLAYADSTTYTGGDTDPTLDTDDEIVFMTSDVGDQVPAMTADPAGVVTGSAVEVRIFDPLDSGVAYAYLFKSDGSLAPGAGANYVTYTFNLLAGSYIPNYNTAAGPNAENSTVVTPFYATHFPDRWIRDELNVLAGTATGVDILDRHKDLFSPGVCGRSEDTFSAGEGAFFANIDGPVRAIRSYMGANSGPLTQRDHYFYEQRQDVVTFLRVHLISGIWDTYDYSPAATGMTYYNDLNTGGATIDGAPDAVTSGPIAWEMVTGAQGTAIISGTLETDIPGFAFTSYYSDDSSPTVTQCTGDAFEYGTSGVWVNQTIPNTDPNVGGFNLLTAKRTVYYEPPNQSIALAALRADQATTPMTLTIVSLTQGSGAPALAARGIAAFLLVVACALVFAGRRRGG